MKILILGRGLLNDEKIIKIPENLGHTLLNARTSREAMRLASNNHIDAVFLDTSVKDVESQKFITEMKNSNPRCKVVVVLEPNFNRLDALGKGREIDYYLIKPLEETYVENIVQMISSDSELNNSRL